MCILTDLQKGTELNKIEMKTVNGASSKSNNKERRREKSKIAARCRRGKESEIFDDLGESLPVTEKIKESLDKASIVRLTICDLKLHKLTKEYNNERMWLSNIGSTTNNIESKIDELYNITEALGGFVIVLSGNGDITYVSENITVSLGLTQCEVMGKSIYEFSHPCDHADVKNLLFVSKGQHIIDNRSATIRLKCTLTSRGNCVHIRAATDKVIQFNGRVFIDDDDKESWFIGIGEAIPNPSILEFPLKGQVFRSTHAADMKCLCADESIEKFLGYKVDDIVGKSLYQFQHAADGLIISPAFKALYVKGQIRTDRYRFLAKNGGWAWAITEATMKPSSGSDSHTIVCRHILISDIQNRDEVLSEVQITNAEGNNNDIKHSTVTSNGFVTPAENNLPLILNDVVGATAPIPSTTKIFAPRTQDMESGFLMPFDCDDTLTKTNDDLDLTHLAPIAGDECVPLNSELFEDFLKFINTANSDYPLIDGSIIDVDELDLLNTSGTSYIPIEDLRDKYLPDFDGSTPLLQESDPVFGSTINLNLPLVAARALSQNEENNNQVVDSQLEPNYFDPHELDMDFFNNLSELSPSINSPMDPSLLGQLSPFFSSDDLATPNPSTPQPYPSTSASNGHSSKVPIVSRNISLADLEVTLLKRKADGNLPKVVTRSILNHVDDSFPPTKFPKLSNSQFPHTSGYRIENVDPGGQQQLSFILGI